MTSVTSRHPRSTDLVAAVAELASYEDLVDEGNVNVARAPKGRTGGKGGLSAPRVLGLGSEGKPVRLRSEAKPVRLVQFVGLSLRIAGSHARGVQFRPVLWWLESSSLIHLVCWFSCAVLFSPPPVLRGNARSKSIEANFRFHAGTW